jgi:hypothetical protein
MEGEKMKQIYRVRKKTYLEWNWEDGAKDDWEDCECKEGRGDFAHCYIGCAAFELVEFRSYTCRPNCKDKGFECGLICKDRPFTSDYQAHLHCCGRVIELEKED